MRILKLLAIFFITAMLLQMIIHIPEVLFFMLFLTIGVYLLYKISKITIKFTSTKSKNTGPNFNDDIDYSSDTDAINENNFMTINHKDRKEFFKGDYFNKEKDGRFGSLRKIKTIEPIFIEYQSGSGEVSKRKVEVFGIKTYDGAAYLYGFCHKKGEDRTFYVGSIKSLIDKNNNKYSQDNIKDYIKTQLLPHIVSEYNKKVVLNCL
jgi:hypothetical protein